MDTAESFGEGTVELDPGESVLFGAVVSTDAQRFSSTIELEVDVPDTDDADGGGGGTGGGTGGTGGTGGGGGDGGGGGTGDASGGGGADDADGDGPGDEPDNGDEDASDEATQEGEGVQGEPDDDAAGDDATDPSVSGDVDTDPAGNLIELAGFGSPVSLIAVGALAAILSLSYAVRLGLIAGGLAGNTGGSE